MIKLRIKNMQKFIVYTISDSKDEIVFINSDQYCRYSRLDGFLNNPEVDENEEYTINFVAIFDEENLAKDYIYNFMRRNSMPRANKMIAFLGRRGVMCLNDGRTWESQTKCAEGEGISQSQLNKHLRGLVGYRTVKGKTYKYL